MTVSQQQPLPPSQSPLEVKTRHNFLRELSVDSAIHAETFPAQYPPHQTHWVSSPVVAWAGNVHIAKWRVCYTGQWWADWCKIPLWGAGSQSQDQSSLETVAPWRLLGFGECRSQAWCSQHWSSSSGGSKLQLGSLPGVPGDDTDISRVLKGNNCSSCKQQLFQVLFRFMM